MSDKLQEICEWYDGYKFGDAEIFNPWSIIQYLRQDCFPESYWCGTSTDDLIRDVIKDFDSLMKERFITLLRGDSIGISFNTSFVYPTLKVNSNAIMNLLLMTGYLTIKGSDVVGGRSQYEVKIPNKEIEIAFGDSIMNELFDETSKGITDSIQQAIKKYNIREIEDNLQRFLVESVSYFDTSSESFYQGLMLGFCSQLFDSYQISSNRESGYGRFDIQMLPKRINIPGIIIELKVLPNEDRLKEDEISSELIELAKSALKQIDDKKYDVSLKANNVGKVIKIGVAFFKKQCELCSTIEEYI